MKRAKPRRNDRLRGIAKPACLSALAWLAALLLASRAAAGPPYVTDDPQPTRTGGWENYVYVTGTNTPGAVAGQAGIELNYGAAPNLQISVIAPEDFVQSHGLRAGAGDPVLSVKYKFLQASADSWVPDAAVFPAVTLPAGGRGYGTGHASVFIPVWLEKDFGKWSVFGGGGYDAQPGAGLRNYTLSGIAVTRSIGDNLSLGMEIYHQTPALAGGAALTNLGFGAIYQMAKHWALMASGGPGLVHTSRAGTSAFYFSIQFTN